MPATPRFQLGRLLITPGALAALEASGESVFTFVQRHQSGDWGTVCESDRHENELSVREGFRILSSYTLKTGASLWIITEASRECTTALLPSEY